MCRFSSSRAMHCIALHCRAVPCRAVSQQRMHMHIHILYYTLLDISLFMLRRSITSSTWLSGR